MATAVVFEDQLRIPPIASLEDFRRWVRSEHFPERGRIDYVTGEIEVDMSPENLFFHGTLKEPKLPECSMQLSSNKNSAICLLIRRVSLVSKQASRPSRIL